MDHLSRTDTGPITPGPDDPTAVARAPHHVADEDGSLVTEYGLLAVLAATIAGVVMTWASGGALVTLFNALLRQARSLVGA
jgi:Flp pilus assembly pilin Flp